MPPTSNPGYSLVYKASNSADCGSISHDADTAMRTAAQMLLSMSEQTCSLHAAMRHTCPNTVRLMYEAAHQAAVE